VVDEETPSPAAPAGGLRLAPSPGGRARGGGAKTLTVAVFAVIFLFLVWDLYDAAVERSPNDPPVGVTVPRQGVAVRGSTVPHDSSAFAPPSDQAGEPTRTDNDNGNSATAPADTNPHFTTVRVP
jgi:hypothetical protein